MKKVIIAVVLIAASMHLRAQSAAAQSEASQTAQAMKDSLSLTDQQKSQVYDATLSLSGGREALKKQYAGSYALPYYLQKVEADRDSLYHTILPPDKYQLYKMKKSNIVNTN